MMRRWMCVAVWAASAGSAHAAQLVVDPLGGGDHTTLTAAVAASASGDEIVLEAGDYTSESLVTVSHDLTIRGIYGAALTKVPLLKASVTGTYLTVDAVTLSCNATQVAPGLDGAEDTTIEALGIQTPDCNDGADRYFVNMFAGTLIVRGATFLGGENQIVAFSSDVTIEDTTFVGPLGQAQAVFVLGLGMALPATLEVRRTSFSSYDVVDDGAAIHATGMASVVIEDSTFIGNTGSLGGAVKVSAATSGSLVVTGSTFDGNTADDGGAIYVSGMATTISDSVFTNNEGVTGAGAVHFTSVTADPLTVTYSDFVGNRTSDVTAGSVYADASGSEVAIRGSHFCGDVGGVTGASVTVDGASAFEMLGSTVALSGSRPSVWLEGDLGVYTIQNVTFAGVANDALRVEGSGLILDVSESIFHDGLDAAIAGLDTSGGSDPPVASGARNNLFDMTFGWATGDFDPSDFDTDATTADPMFQNYVDMATTTCDDINLWLDFDSPLRDLGDGLDLDQTDSDIGGFGGPWADLADADGDLAYEDIDCDEEDNTISPWAGEIPYDGIDQDCDGADLMDADGDGFDGPSGTGEDCDDDEAQVYPGATEVWYDGIDQDCDGADDFDQDMDGYQSGSHGGDDCNDVDPFVYPGATDHPEDGIDQDCSGEDATTGGSTGSATGGAGDGGGCGCSTSSAPAGSWGWLLAGLAWLARRRR